MADRPAYHHGNLREALLDAAEQALREHGPEALTLRDIARRAGVSHGAPYHHFDSRDAVLAAVAERGFEGLASAMAAARGATPQARLAAVATAYVDFALREPTQFRLMFGPLMARKADYPGLKDAGERAFGLLLEAAQAVDPAHALPLALSGWSLSHGLAHLAINGVFGSLPLPEPVRSESELARALSAWLLQRLSAGA